MNSLILANIIQSNLTGGATEIIAPTTQATSIQFTNVNGSSMTVSVTTGNGTFRLFVGKSGGAVDSNPVDNTGYTGNTVFGSGSEIGTGNFVLHAGTLSSIDITGLSPGTTYHFRVYEFNGNSGNQKYFTDTATGNPASQATGSLFYALYNFGGEGTDPAVADTISVWDETKSTSNEDYGILGSNGVTVIAVNQVGGGPPTLSSGQYWGWKSGSPEKAFDQVVTGTNIYDNSILNCYWFSQSTPCGIRFEGIPNGTYTIKSISLRTGEATTRTTQTSFNGSATVDVTTNTSSTADVLTSEVNGTHMAIFEDIVVSDGIIYGLFSPLSTSFHFLNAIEIIQTA